MAYEKHTWETGETITAEKLNNLEDGVKNIVDKGLSSRVVTITAEDFVACADENNIVNEWDLFEHAVKRHIGLVSNGGNGLYLMIYDCHCDTSMNSNWWHSYPVSLIDVYFMGQDTSANMGISSYLVFGGVMQMTSKASDLPQYAPATTISGTTYQIIPISGTYTSWKLAE